MALKTQFVHHSSDILLTLPLADENQMRIWTKPMQLRKGLNQERMILLLRKTPNISHYEFIRQTEFIAYCIPHGLVIGQTVCIHCILYQ